MPQRPSAWAEVETGETFADAWNTADRERRRLMLINTGARLYLSPTTIGWHLPKTLQPRIEQSPSLALTHPLGIWGFMTQDRVVPLANLEWGSAVLDLGGS